MASWRTLNPNPHSIMIVTKHPLAPPKSTGTPSQGRAAVPTWMARKKKKPTSLGLFPMLTKPSAAIGKQASVPGPYWTNARQRTRENASCAHGRRVQGSSRFWPGQHSATIDQFKDKEKIVNEFALLYHVRKSFPLHYIVFKQTASHLPHEGNSEQLFSRAGFLSDDKNGKTKDSQKLGG